MFAKLFVVATVLTALAVATPTEMMRRTEPAGSCTTGSMNCCSSSSTAKDQNVATQLATLGVVVEDVNALIGIDCSPVAVVGPEGPSCSSQALCCTGNSFNGLTVGCVPVNL